MQDDKSHYKLNETSLLEAVKQIITASSYRLAEIDVDSENYKFSCIAGIGSLTSRLGSIHLDCTYRNTRISGELAKCSWEVGQSPMVSIAFSEGVEKQFKFSDPGRVFNPSLALAARELCQSLPAEIASELCVTFRVTFFLLKDAWIDPLVETEWEPIRKEVETKVQEPQIGTLEWACWSSAVINATTDRFFKRFEQEFESIRAEIAQKSSESIRKKLLFPRETLKQNE